MPSEDLTVAMEHADTVDLFAGPGGLDVAARWLGRKVYGLEWDADACKTREAAGLNFKCHDVRKFGPENFPTATMLIGGPPCQTFTVAGNGAGRRALDIVLKFIIAMAAGESVQHELARLEDERTGLVLEPLRWALRAAELGRPYRTIVLEQVPAVLPVWEAMAIVLRDKLQYHVETKVLHTERYGVPQTRRRAVLIATLDGPRSIPQPTHQIFRKSGLRPTDDHHLPACKTMADALPHRTEAFVVISNYGTGGDPKARGVRESTQPSATITGKVSRNKVVSSGRTDRFSELEAGRLQSFPEDYPWRGGAVAQQIGNAVPPIFGLHVLSAALGCQVTRELAEDIFLLKWAEVQDEEKNGVPAVLTELRERVTSAREGARNDRPDPGVTYQPALLF
ncbi:DNA cytosine methyltransferase [Nocardia africana]|uniref:DNA cytosine methyltransferase n=1 Tax=Nocardia africana TaxID=134964 RepID=UPI0007C6CE62|nr:DNA cytosine methyltransferase [Nocardia africana]MCC3311878.1 DNA cytosine methyltransferase [Nocardia africana]